MKISAKVTALCFGLILLMFAVPGCSRKTGGADILYFSSYPDTVIALKSNKIDAFPSSRMSFSQYQAADDSLTVIEGEIDSLPMAYAFPKNERGNYTILKANSESVVHQTDPDGTRSSVCVRIS